MYIKNPWKEDDLFFPVTINVYAIPAKNPTNYPVAQSNPVAVASPTGNTISDANSICIGTTGYKLIPKKKIIIITI